MFKFQSKKRFLILLLVIQLWPVGCMSSQSSDLSSKSPLVRRRAVRNLADKGMSSRTALLKALDDEDIIVRREAFRGLCSIDSKKSITYCEKMFSDHSELIRLAVVEELAAFEPRTEKVEKLLVLAGKDKSKDVSKAANDALWPFYRNKILIRDRVDLDYDVEVIKTISLPKKGWKFKTDPQSGGHVLGWYKDSFDDSKWANIEIEKAWQEFGYNYIGTSWYRLKVKLPNKIEHIAAELVFGGVDENAWVWVNGVYVGEHAIGPTGWNQPFKLDVTDEIKWGKVNQITVRAMNTANAGGIWKPVNLDILKLNKVSN